MPDFKIIDQIKSTIQKSLEKETKLAIHYV